MRTVRQRRHGPEMAGAVATCPPVIDQVATDKVIVGAVVFGRDRVSRLLGPDPVPTRRRPRAYSVPAERVEASGYESYVARCRQGRHATLEADGDESPVFRSIFDTRPSQLGQCRSIRHACRASGSNLIIQERPTFSPNSTITPANPPGVLNSAAGGQC